MAGDLDAIIDRLLGIRSYALELEHSYDGLLDALPDDARESARNLLHYLALRRHDLRPLQDELWRQGLSSLGRAEAHVLANLEAVLGALHRMAGRTFRRSAGDPPALGFDAGRALLDRRADRTLGPLAGDRAARVMVTMPREAAADPTLIERFARSGMNLVRINTAHDDPEVWRRMVGHVRQAEKGVGRRLGIAFDLAGPKLRTGALEPGPRVARLRPRRDALGRVVEAARLRLVDGDAPAGVDVDGVMTVGASGAGLSTARVGDVMRFVDARGRRRRLVVRAVDATGVLAEGDRTAYLLAGLPVALSQNGDREPTITLGTLPALEAPILLSPGDVLVLTRDPAPGRPAEVDEAGRTLTPARIPCSIPEVFRDARAGQRILFDDGEFAGTIEEVRPDALRVRIDRVARGTGKLRAEKGINLPDTLLEIPAITDEDRESLAAIAAHADLVSLSFVQRPEDVDALVAILHDLGRPDVGIVLKIETERAFRRLPALLLAALRHSNVAVMLARGDLAVEVGFERLAELQEEILWLCEAAHVPTIWATQVLESLAKTGVPSRAEVTDAVASTRAECVMLNKGPHAAEAVEFLVDVIARARGHQEKKRPMLRRLRVADFDAV